MGPQGQPLQVDRTLTLDHRMHTALLAPVFALAAWTFCILLLTAVRRVRAGLAGRVSPREYRLGESGNVPADVALPNRNYMNLLELPLLFYLGSVVAAVAGLAPHTQSLLIVLGWLYVALRVAHSLIHVTYNHVLHRFAAFAASNGVLVAYWVSLGLALFGARAGA